MTTPRMKAVTAAAVMADKICNGFMESMRMLSYKIDGNLDKKKWRRCILRHFFDFGRRAELLSVPNRDHPKICVNLQCGVE